MVMGVWRNNIDAVVKSRPYTKIMDPHGHVISLVFPSPATHDWEYFSAILFSNVLAL
jgi:hypothetical protein